MDRARIVLLCAWIAAPVAACGLDAVATFGGSGGDAGALDGAAPGLADGSSPGDDATDRDGGAADARLDQDAQADLYRCGDASVTSCLACDAGAFLCREAGACVDVCKTSCGASQIECVGCTTAGSVAVAVCETPGAGQCTKSPLRRCACSAPAECPGPRQVCSMGSCLGCGEPGSDNLACKEGNNCDDDGTGNANDNYTCR